MLPDGSSNSVVNFWVDVSTLRRWEGKITGIPRTVSQFVDALTKQASPRVRLCSYNGWLRAYEETPLLTVQLPTAAVAASGGAARPVARREPAPTIRDHFRPLFRVLPTDLQHAFREGTSALRHLARFVVRSGGSSLLNLGKGALRGAARLLLRRKEKVLFQEGDVLFVPGASWDDFGALDALADIKKIQKLRVVPILYDIIPAKMPQVCHPLLPQLFNPWIRKLLANSDLILTISQYSRRDLLALTEQLGVPAPPVEVIRLGDAPAGFDQPMRPPALPDEVQSFALTVGTFEARKNHWLLYQTWRRLIQQHGDKVPPLVLAGRMGWATRDVLQQIHDDPVVRDRILVLFDATDEELSWLYRNCAFTLYPSHYEGWGLPVAESLVYGKYCVCTNASSVPEVAGDLVDYHDPLDAMTCMDLIRRTLFEPGFLQGREARIHTEFRGATWAECAARLVPLMEKSLGVYLRGETAAESRAA